MKKTLLMAILVVMSCLNACTARDQLITFAQLPEAGQQLVQANFDVNNIAYVKMDVEFLGKEYEVRFNDGTELDLEGDGSLKKVDCKYQAVPVALVPEIVRQQIAAQFPQAVIVEWGKDDWGWKAELNNKLELKFNRSFELIGLDD